jgi:hypothetical protein
VGAGVNVSAVVVAVIVTIPTPTAGAGSTVGAVRIPVLVTIPTPGVNNYLLLLPQRIRIHGREPVLQGAGSEPSGIISGRRSGMISGEEDGT